MTTLKPYTSSNSFNNSLSPRSPKSPTSPVSPRSPKLYPNVSPHLLQSESLDVVEQIKDTDSIPDVLRKTGFSNVSKITSTLQGTIWSATTYDLQSVVIKTTSKYLHDKSMSSINGQTSHVQEDILLEQSILKYVTQQQDCPKSIVKFQDFFQTNCDYYMVMEHGGSSLFNFVKKAHRLIQCGRIEADHWKRVIKLIFKQMVSCIDFLHSKNVCHFDISLENFLINDVNVEIIKSKTTNREILRFLMNDIQIRLCDFGLANLFTKSVCKSCKFCGKESYASPELMVNKKGFDAKANDIWCLGVSLFMLSTGKSPWNVADKKDKSFLYIVEYGQLLDVLVAWNVLRFIDENLFDLFESIFQYEKKRISIKDIKQHLWINRK